MYIFKSIRDKCCKLSERQLSNTYDPNILNLILRNLSGSHVSSLLLFLFLLWLRILPPRLSKQLYIELVSATVAYQVLINSTMIFKLILLKLINSKETCGLTLYINLLDWAQVES